MRLNNLSPVVCMILTLSLCSAPTFFSDKLSPQSKVNRKEKIRSITTEDGAVIRYEVRGNLKAKQTLFMIHGFSADKTHWYATLRHNLQLFRNYRVVLVNLRGKGRGDDKSEPGNLHQLHYYKASINDIKMILDQENISTAIFMGHSMGGEIAQYFVKSYPKRAEALVLVGSFSRFPLLGYTLLRYLKIDKICQGIARFLLRFPKVVHQLDRIKDLTYLVVKRAPFIQIIRWSCNKIVFRDVSPKAFKNQYLPISFSARFQAFLAGAAAMGASERDFNGVQIQVPTLIVQGSSDNLVKIGEANRLQKQIPHAIVELFEGERHVPHLDKVRFPKILNTFLGKLQNGLSIESAL